MTKHLFHFPFQNLPSAVLHAAVLFMMGCSDSGTAEKPPAVQPFAGVRLKIAVPEGSGLAQSWQSLLIEWSARTGAETEFVEWPSAIPKGPPADLMFFDLARLPDLANRRWLATIPNSVRDDAGVRWNDVAKGLATNALSSDRQAVAVPFAAPVLVLYYRKDLLEKFGAAPPDSWAAYQKLLENRQQWAGDLPFVEPWGESFRETMLVARAISFLRHPGNYSIFFDVETGDPALRSPGWERAMQQASDALRLMPKEVLSYSAEECRREILEGRAAMAIGLESPPNAGPDSPALTPQRSSRPDGIALGITRLPGSDVAFNRTTGAWDAVSGGAQHVDVVGFRGLAAGVSTQASDDAASAAWNLLSTLSDSAALQTAFPDPFRTFCRLSQTPEGRAWHGHDLTDREGDEFLRATSEALRDARLTFDLPIIERDDFRKAFAQGLEKWMAGKESAEEALARIESDWNSLLAKIGKEKVRDSYRRHLGLPVRTP